MKWRIFLHELCCYPHILHLVDWHEYTASWLARLIVCCGLLQVSLALTNKCSGLKVVLLSELGHSIVTTVTVYSYYTVQPEHWRIL